jgi:haloacid dehalogenase superfamily, subfamily IA, variant 1 with third motif having Dx(3-4)D or Dx(3-4)E
MTEAVVFDLDGTLLNTIEDIRDSMNRALSACGLPTYEADSYCYFVGSGVKILAERAVGENHLELAEKVGKLYQADYDKNAANLTRPYEGIPELLKALNEKNIPVAVLSNKPHEATLKVVAHYFPDITFACVRGQMDGVPVKPDPQGTFEIVRALNLTPANCLYAGDTMVDMTCANAAGMKAVGVTWGFRKEEELKRGHAAYIVHRPQEILKLI